MRFIISFFIGVIVMFVLVQFLPTKSIPVIKKLPQKQTTFDIDKAPSDSLQGKISSLSGEVEWKSRTATEAALITKPVRVLQGEELVTKDNGEVTLSFTGLTIALSEQTTLSVIQTLPANIVFEQNSGKAVYKKSDTTPVTIRSLDLLIDLPKQESEVTVSATESTITVTAQKGSLTAAYNTLDNVTTVVTINEGQDYTFDNDSRHGVKE